MKRTTLANQRFTYFARNLLRLALPGWWLRARVEPCLDALSERDRSEALQRLAYYNRVGGPFDPGTDADRWRWSAFQKQRNYCFDLLESLRHFDLSSRLCYRFGDDTEVPKTPTIVKARPIDGDNANAVLLKLNRVRHFRVVEDRKRFADKLDSAVWRGKASQPHRQTLLANCHGKPGCDVARIDPCARWQAPYMTIPDQLDHKFVVSIEGNDVATNLKWIFASNSVCLMRRPRFETWFMEGTLVPDRHYILVADDYSDVPDKVRFYSRRPDLVEPILRDARAHAARFVDPRRESAIALLVLLKYFVDSGQEPAARLERVTRTRREEPAPSRAGALGVQRQALVGAREFGHDG